MAAAFTVVITCSICGFETTITDVIELAAGSHRTKEPRHLCSRCRTVFPISFASIALTHTGDVGSNQTLTHTMATPGTITSAASNPA